MKSVKRINKKMNTNKKTKKKRNENTSCSPKEKGQMNSYSCYSNASLLKLRNLWNARHPHSSEKITTKDPKKIHQELEMRMSNVCNKETCWLSQDFTSGSASVKQELKESFAPTAPKEWKKNPNEWLSSLDIIRVMKQYENAYKCFQFIGPSPIDFDTKLMYGKCVWTELCSFNIADELKRGKKKIGIIFNTDKHDGPGEHWISLFINVNKKQIFFFDSAGDKAPLEIVVFVNRVIEQGKALKEPIYFQFDENYPVEHQHGNSECGVYSLYFVIYMLEDKINGNYLKTHIIPDKQIEKYRRVFFNVD
jgi:hypothetical protein